MTRPRSTAPESSLLHDPARRSWSGDGGQRPVRATVWRPAPSGPHPVVLLSHGTGGSADSLAWLAEALCASGFLVAAVDHHGNTSVEDYLVEGFVFGWERARDLSVLLDHVAAVEDVDASRVGAAGFSLGGYTVMALLGARIDPGTVGAVVDGTLPAPAVPEFPDLVATLRRGYDDERLAAIVADGSGSMADERVRAGFAVAPALGLLVSPESLGLVDAPVELRWGDADDICPPQENALVYLDALPGASGHSVGRDVGHYDFLGDADDPGSVRRTVAADAVDFFRRTLTAERPTLTAEGLRTHGAAG